MWCRSPQTLSCLRLLAWTQTVMWRGHEKRECSLSLCTLPILILEQVWCKTQLGSSVAPDVEERVVWQGDCSLQPLTEQFHSRGREAQGTAGSQGCSLQGSQLGELGSCAPLAQALKGMDFTKSNAKEERKMVWENICQVKWAKLHTHTLTAQQPILGWQIYH